MTPRDFFRDRPIAWELFVAASALMADLDGVAMRIRKSQIDFRRRRDFAWMWCPDRYLDGRTLAPLVLSVSLPSRDPSPRWKQIVDPSPGRFMHHLELRSLTDVDEQVRHWLGQAYAFAGGETVTRTHRQAAR